MIDSLVALALSNTLFALLLASAAQFVATKLRNPRLAHLLWLLVLVKLMTPPLVSLPVTWLAPKSATRATELSRTVVATPVDENHAVSLTSNLGTLWNSMTPWLGAIWLAGSAVILTWSLVRVYRFNRLLRETVDDAPPDLETMALTLANRFGLRKSPRICTTTAHVSPMVWWIGGAVHVLIPVSLLQRMDRSQWRWVLAHELAHVRRGDHHVRWLEWLALVGFWWNPLAWWAQRNLRAIEEMCCDALVISTLNPQPQTYANSILLAIESLTRPTVRPPALASEINSGGFLERRFMMMISDDALRANSIWLHTVAVLSALIVLPMGVAFSQNYDAVGERLRAAVEAEEITGEQARFMIGALRLAEGLNDRAERSFTREEYGAAEAKLKEMVDRGEVSDEDARTRLNEMRRMISDGRKEHDDRQAARWESVKKRIEGAVERGDLTRKEADQKYAEIRRRMAGPDRREKGITREEYGAAEAKLKALVEAGEVPEEAARIRLKEMRRMIGDRREERPRWEDMRRRIEHAVEEGELSREEADAKYAAIKKEMKAEGGGHEDAPDDLDWEPIKRRIEAAVRRGDLTREEADAAYRALKK